MMLLLSRTFSTYCPDIYSQQPAKRYRDSRCVSIYAFLQCFKHVILLKSVAASITSFDGLTHPCIGDAVQLLVRMPFRFNFERWTSVRHYGGAAKTFQVVCIAL